MGKKRTKLSGFPFVREPIFPRGSARINMIENTRGVFRGFTAAKNASNYFNFHSFRHPAKPFISFALTSSLNGMKILA